MNHSAVPTEGVTTPPEILHRAASLMRERADVWSYHSSSWRVEPVAGGWSEVRSTGTIEDDFADGSPVVHHDTYVFQMDTTSTAEHIASWHPAVALAVAEWLDAVAVVHWPKRHDRYSESHYSAEPGHEIWGGDCDETCWVESYICNGCGTSTCKPEITSRALAVANAYLGEATA